MTDAAHDDETMADPTSLPPGDEGEEQWQPPPKLPPFAFALNFFLPGAGLLYLGKPLAALVNFLGALTIYVAVYFLLSRAAFDEWAPSVGLLVQGGSGLWAVMATNEINRRAG